MKTRPSRIFCLSVAGAGRSGIRANRAGVRGAVAAAVIAFVAVAALPQAAQAQSSAVAVLQSEMTDVKAAIIRIDTRLERMDEKFTKRFERMDERLDRMDEKFTKRFGSVEQSIVRLDEKMNGLQMQNQFLIIPLLLMILATMFGLLTKGILWGIDRAPKSAGVAHRGGGAQPVATPA